MATIHETIAALATPRGTGGVAMIRVSGPESWPIVQRLSRRQVVWEAGRVAYDWILDPADRQLVDEVMILPFKAPKSFTGEDCIEIHCHGGLVVSRAILTLCLNAGARPAEAGEFTRRALLNGRIDLTQAESVLDLIHAQGEALVKLAANNLHHRSLGRLLERYLEDLSVIQADLTACIDFPDEVDEPERAPLASQLQALAAELAQHLAQGQQSQVLRDGIRVAVAGLPNAGKSSLFNALLATERSIVTEIAGTTRDTIHETLSVQGIPVMLIDTAGLRETADRVEQIGVSRSREALDSAQAVLYVVDGTVGLQQDDIDVIQAIDSKPGLLVFNKADHTAFQGIATDFSPSSNWQSAEASATEPQGITPILDWLDALTESLSDTSQLAYVLSHRQLHHLGIVQADIHSAAETLANRALPFDLATVPLTDALLELQGLLGKDTTEHVLDAVFSRFCVGK